MENKKFFTPVEYIEEEGIWLKRDDKFEICGVRGGKSRAAYQVIQQLVEKGYKTMVTAGSRQSPQCEIVSYICEDLGLKCKVFMPTGANTSVIDHIEENPNTEVIRVRPGYNNVIIARAREYAEDRNCGYVPFGMECAENVAVTSKQAKNLPILELRESGGRLVIPVGSGMSFSSVITGLHNIGVYDIPILGVQVGKDPSKIIQQYAEGLELMDYSIESSGVDYHTNLCESIGNVELDPVYEAKCRPFVNRGDCLWIVGKRV